MSFILKATVIRATKTSNLCRNIAAKLVEKRFCAFYIPRTTSLAAKKLMCCKLMLRSVSESRGPFYFLHQKNQHIHIFLLPDRLCVGCKARFKREESNANEKYLLCSLICIRFDTCKVETDLKRATSLFN